MRPIFCGNFEYDARQTELERLFKRYGRVERVDMKSVFDVYSKIDNCGNCEDVNRTITELLNMYGRTKHI
ncbi:hypothetical protein NC653_035442 [Populus alba x Populus x berolinensis]|uniref:RRM domain-containing protein n=1 Tax=Populus alba x Populus x berolinensis TaxID=444605 RepID=A0AAD6LQI9_9ROSI|nr:hypothetical protein NC653_035442 [Populus alba x Populus x berolinensis]